MVESSPASSSLIAQASDDDQSASSQVIPDLSAALPLPPSSINDDNLAGDLNIISCVPSVIFIAAGAVLCGKLRFLPCCSYAGAM